MSLKSAGDNGDLCTLFQQNPLSALSYTSPAEEASAVKAVEHISGSVKINFTFIGQKLLPFPCSEPQNPSSGIMMDHF